MIMDNLSQKLDFARAVAQEAGALALRMLREAGPGFTSAKGHQDFVTEADEAVEHLIRSRIEGAYPGDGVLGEEGGQSGGGSGVWVVDPIDGTGNYLRGLPDWGISLAYVEGGQIRLGVLCFPGHRETAWAMQGGGAWLNGEPMRVSTRTDPDEALVILGRSERTGLDGYLVALREVLRRGAEYRRHGAAAYGLFLVASGRAETYFEAHVNCWDVFGGMILVEEAGGSVRAAPVPEALVEGTAIEASNGVITGLLAEG